MIGILPGLRCLHQTRGGSLASARNHWAWLLSQPCPAAEVWRELRLQVGRRADRIGPRDPGLLVLYGQLPDGCADSVVLCRWIGFDVDEAAEPMGAEPPAVEVALTVARRTLPHLIGRSSAGTPAADQREHRKMRAHQIRNLQLHDAHHSLITEDAITSSSSVGTAWQRPGRGIRVRVPHDTSLTVR
ncbi:hypothetical protein [Streptomyces fulvorobeus]|uniref:Uncharacterized protein n=1 Tax=Streptomyces fulvorobeus TaxID=284028 RepID=A0A7Y9HA30_9ACTN|nr:hypothetical protein [Streptomyces fulvorobeus]NYE40658.1 hypothetical protein [Streptomyces fulvorobeus]